MLSTAIMTIKKFFKNLKIIYGNDSVLTSIINLWIIIFMQHLLKDINSLLLYNNLKIK